MRMFVFVVVAVVLAGACNKNESDYPIIVGGRGPGGGGLGTDGGITIDGNDAGPVMAGLVCLLPDPRDLNLCATTGAGGLAVTLDGTTVMTADNGTFAMPVPNGTNLVWEVQSPTMTVIPSLMSFSAIPVIPVINADLYHSLQLSNGVIDTDGQGAIMGRVLQSNLPLTGSVATALPAPVADPAYDGNDPSTWNHNGTGPNGTLWLAGLAAGSATLTITPFNGTALNIAAIPVGNEAITFVTVDVPL